MAGALVVFSVADGASAFGITELCIYFVLALIALVLHGRR